MSDLVVDFKFEVYDTAGSQMLVEDITPDVSANTPHGYGSPQIDRSHVSQVRLLISNYPAILAETVVAAGETLTQYVEYQMTSGSSNVYDGKTINVGNFFIPAISGLTVLSGDEFTATGKYVKYIAPATFLPTTSTTQLILSIADMNLDSSNTTVPDLVFNNTYEVYGQKMGSPFTTVDGLRYINVIGTSVTFNGNTYRQGETFLGDGSVYSSTTAAVAPLKSATEKTFITTYNVEAAAYQLNIDSLTKQRKPIPLVAIRDIYDLIESLKWSVKTQAVSFSKATDLIALTESKISILENNGA